MSSTLSNETQSEVQNLLNETSTSIRSFSLKGVNLCKAYTSQRFLFLSKSSQTILSNVNINIERGKIYGLLGPSGMFRSIIREIFFFNF